MCEISRRPALMPRRGAVRRFAALGLALALALPGPARAATEIARGDVLRVEVMDAPEFSREAAVDADGRIALPILGMVPVAGMDLDTARAKIEAALQAHDLLNDPVVLVEIAAYRPVYVGGTVAHQGAIAYVPGLTVRQAVIASGGVRLGPESGEAAPENALAAIAARRATAFRLAQVEARIARLKAEIDGADSLADGTEAADQSALLQERRARIRARDAHVDELLDLITLEIGTLDQQAALQDTEARLQQEEIDSARDLVNRGLMPRPKLQEMLRDQSQLSRDRLENRAFAARAGQEAATVRYEQADAKAQTREALRHDLAEAEGDRASLIADLETLQLRILAAGLSSPGQKEDAAELRLTIHRTVGGTPRQITAVLDDVLLPGDVLELALDTAAAAPAQTDAGQ